MQRYLPIDKKSNLDILSPLCYANLGQGIDFVISKGLAVNDFAVSRSSSNPSTFVDDNSIMQKVETSNTPRQVRKIYQENSGVVDLGKKGLWIESQQTNYLIHSIFDTDGGSGLATGWTLPDSIGGTPTTSLVDIKSTFNIGTSVNAQRIQYTGIAADSGQINLRSDLTSVGSFSQGDVVTVSGFLKGNFSGLTEILIAIIERDAGGGVLTTQSGSDFMNSISDTEFRFFTYTTTISNASASRVNVDFQFKGIDENDTLDIQVTAAQIEKSPYATTHIPTTTTSLTRNGEVLECNIAGNAAIEDETILIRALFPYDLDENTTNRRVLDNDGDKRRILNDATANTITFTPNFTDSPSSIINDGTTLSKNTVYSLAFLCNNQTSVYAQKFVDGVSDGTNETTDNFVSPDYGSFFYIGCSTSGTLQADGIFFEFARFDKELTQSQITQSTNSNYNNIRR